MILMYTYWIKNLQTGRIVEFFLDEKLGEPGDILNQNFEIVDYAEYLMKEV